MRVWLAETFADQTTGVKESGCRVQVTLTPQTEPI